MSDDSADEGADIGPAELAAAIEAGCPPLVLDVRSRREYRRGHVPGAVHLPFWRIAARHDELPEAPEAGIVVYCGHGPRAAIARRGLEKLGYRSVRLLRGHWSGWRRAGLPIDPT